MHQVWLNDGTDLDEWRAIARALLHRGIAPDTVLWQAKDPLAIHPDPAQHTQDLFGQSLGDAPLPADTTSFTGHCSAVVHAGCEPPATTSPLHVPAHFLHQAQLVVLHHSPHRFTLLYRLLWRLQREPGLRHDPLDADRVVLARWAQAVRRDGHKMKAFVRFRPLDAETTAAPPPDWDGPGALHVAWFEPDHQIVQAIAPFFVRRFANMRWSILTPQCSLRWYPKAPSVQAIASVLPELGHSIQPLPGRPGVLTVGPGARKTDAPPADAGEALWLTYYAHIFNPNRLKLQTMAREMPRKYWHNLPEAQLIAPLVHAAAQRSTDMLTATPQAPRRSRTVPSAPR